VVDLYLPIFGVLYSSEERTHQAGQMFREFDQERPLSPLLQIKRTTIGYVAPLFCFQPTRHARVMYHEDMFGVEDERADVHVACTDEAD
jgi:hypothetical protein